MQKVNSLFIIYYSYKAIIYTIMKLLIIIWITSTIIRERRIYSKCYYRAVYY